LQNCGCRVHRWRFLPSPSTPPKLSSTRP
jgi:hypothetical protein